MFDSRAYYSVKDNILWKHLDLLSNKSRLEYYGDKYDYVVDIPLISKEGVKRYNNIIYRQDLNHSEILPYIDNMNILQIEPKKVLNTFTHYVAYNDTQSTGIQDLVLKNNIFDNSNLSYYNNRFTFSLAREQSLTKKFYDWNLIEDRIYIKNNQVSFTDKLFTNNLTDKEFLNNAHLKDDYVNIRMTYNPQTAEKIYNTVDVDLIQHKVSLDLIDALTSNTI